MDDACSSCMVGMVARCLGSWPGVRCQKKKDEPPGRTDSAEAA